MSLKSRGSEIRDQPKTCVRLVQSDHELYNIDSGAMRDKMRIKFG